jgi:aminoglycoside 2''-phosphotransferase
LDRVDGSQQWREMYAQVQARLFPAMRADACRSVTQHFENFLQQADLLPEEQVLRHGDLGGSNILYDPRGRRLCGVIDFSECALGDPAVDLAAISTLGEDFLQRVLVGYTSDEASRALLLERLRFYRGTFALQEALAGLENGDQAAYRSGMESYL